MADRIDIGLGPRLGTAPTDTSGFQFTGQTPISRQEYLSRPVDFTSEFLDTATLGQQTGIDVGAPEVGQDIAPVNVRDEQDQNDDDIPDILQGNLVSGDGKSREIVVGLDAISGGTQYATYSDYLRNKGMADRVDIGKVESLYEPIASGKFGDIDLEKFGTEVKQDVEAIPSEVQTGLEKLSTPKGRAEIGEKAAQGLIGLAGGPLGAIAASFIGGVGVRNAFGQTSFRPSGLFGAVADMVHSRQYQDMAQIRAAESAARTDIDFAAARPDTGFAIRFGNFGLTRAPGARSYTGNMQGMSLEQVKELEALSKGYLPNTYQFDTSKRENIFGGKANVTVEESGGAYSDPNNKLKGFYTADGKYYTPGVGYSRYGNAADRNRLAATNGFTENEMQDIIEDARAGKGNLADLIQQEKDNRAAETAAAKAEQERLAEIERNRQEQARIENAYSGDSSSGGSDDDGGWSAGGAGSGGSGGFGVGSFGTSGGGDRGFTGGFADGGTVGMAAGGAMAANMNSGFIGAPPSQVSEEKTVADDQLTEYPEGTFIINAAAVEFAGEKDIVKMLNDAQKEAVRRGIVLDNSEKGAKLIDVAVSQGEVKVAPYLAKIIGYDRLNKINNRGKPEVAERQKEASQGGMLGMAEGGEVPSPIQKPKLEQLADVELRADLETFIQGDSLARLGYMLYENRDMRLKAIPLNQGSRASMLGQYFPANDERVDEERRHTMQSLRGSAVGRKAKEQGIPDSELDARVPSAYVLTGLLEPTKRDDGSGLYDSAKKTSNLKTIAHELRHAAIDYLSKRYNFTLPDLKTEERLMDYADNLATENAAKVNPEIGKQYAKQKNIGSIRDRGKSASTIPRFEKAYNALTQMADIALKEEGYPKQTPAVEQEGFLTRGMKSLFN